MSIKLLLVRTDGKENQYIHPITDAPLGILSLSAIIKRDLPGEVDVRIRDLRLKGYGATEFRREILEWRPDVVGVSALSAEAERTADLARLIKEASPETAVIVGGPYPSATPTECLEATGADAVFRGESEASLCSWLRRRLDGKSADDVPGLAMRDAQGRPFLTDLPESFEDVDSFPMPDWEAIDVRDYFSGYSMNVFTAHRRYASIMTSRGCPYQCVYCHRFFGRKVRFRDLSAVLEEMGLLYHKYGVREFQICDDTFNIDTERVIEFCQMLKESEMRVYLSFPNGLRGDLLTEEVLDALKDVGAYMIVFPIESASPRIQKLIKKNLNLEKVTRMIRYANSRGIITKGYFMLGFVTETEEEIRQTVDMALSLPLLHVSFFTVIPQKNTELYEITKKHDPEFDLWDNTQYYGHSPSYTQKMGIPLPKIQRWAFVRFYFFSTRLPRLLWRFPRRIHFLTRFFSLGLRAFMGMR